MKTSPVETPFTTELRNQIRSHIRTCKQIGIVSMRVENLMLCVQPPAGNIYGAPLGTNARYYYTQMFREICQEITIKSFII